MSRREWVACVGASLGLLAAQYAPSWLALSRGWSVLAAQEPTTARYVSGLLILPLPAAGAILACALLNFAEVHGLAGPQRRRRRPLPPYPFDSHKTQLVIGETHEQDGTRSEQPSWLVLPEKGLYTGILITGATGSAKTSAAQYPFTAQLIHQHARDGTEWAGSSSTRKGNYVIRSRQCALAGRLPILRGQPDQGVAGTSSAAPISTRPRSADTSPNDRESPGPSCHPYGTGGKDLAYQVIRVLRLRKGGPTWRLYRAHVLEAFEDT